MSALILPSSTPSLDGSALTACNAAGITDSRARARMAQFFAGLRTLGLHDDLVDGACYRPGFQKVASSIISLKGYAATIGSAPVLGQGGLQFDGVDDYVKHVVPNMAGAGRTLFWWGASNLANGSPQVCMSLENATNRLFAYTETFLYAAGGGAVLWTYGGVNAGNTAGDSIINQNTPETHMVVGRDTNAGGASGTLSLHVDGRTKKDQTATCDVISQPMTDIMISAQKTTTTINVFSKTCVGSWLAFGKALTDGEIASVRALVESTICPRVILLVEGDSLSSGTCWANYMPDDPNSWGIVDTSFIGAGGENSTDVVASYAAQINAVKPASGEQKWLMMMIGANDCANLSDSAAVIFARIQSIWAQARADGFRVCAMTVTAGAGITGAGRQAIRTALNTSIRNAANEYDVLVDVDRFFQRLTGDTTTYYTHVTYFNADQIHLIAAGWSALGAEVDRCMKFQDIPL